MELFELLKEVVKGIVRGVTAHLFQRHILDKEKTTRRRRKQGSSRNDYCDNPTCTAEAARGRIAVLPLFLSISILT